MSLCAASQMFCLQLKHKCSFIYDHQVCIRQKCKIEAFSQELSDFGAHCACVIMIILNFVCVQNDFYECTKNAALKFLCVIPIFQMFHKSMVTHFLLTEVAFISSAYRIQGAPRSPVYLVYCTSLWMKSQ